MKLTYVIRFVGDMDRAVAFHRDTLGLPLTFSSPGWSEFATGETKLGLHPASEKNPPGTIELGLGIRDLQKFFRGDVCEGSSVQHAADEAGFWRRATRFVDSEGGQVTVSDA
jgi:catechol 2,3-dioxygenase-like lactoylglutathione lyase family enzyme